MELSAGQVRRLRLRAQRLQPRLPRQSLLDAVRAVCGIQAQSVPAMRLALRARVADLTAADVAAAIGEASSADRPESHALVRAWAMRSTLHLLPAEDVRWLVALLGPALVAAEATRRRELGLSDGFLERAVAAVRLVLAAAAPLTRWEIVERLESHGITIERRGQMAIHLVHYAALEGVICCGPDRPGGEPTYVLADRWLPPQPPIEREPALAALARRYLRGYAPATVKDLATWAGISQRDARRACGQAAGSGTPPAYVEATVAGQAGTYLVPAGAAAADGSPSLPPVVRLLPMWDDYLLGYADRSLVVPPAHVADVYRGGVIGPAVVVDGMTVGTWRLERHGRRAEVLLALFGPVDDAVRSGIAAEVDDVGRFLTTPTTFAITPPRSP